MTLSGGAAAFTNHLAGQKSPYLLQHVHNPVDWYPWGDAAFAKAAKEHKPIFLSIGYSTCHWCHVMERESFEDGTIAAFLNAHFVAIKVDREERPDVDALYMSYVTGTTGSGGWPMSVLLTPDRKPFFGGTYYPPEAFLDLLRQAAKVWTEQPDRVRAASTEAASFLAQPSRSGTGSGADADLAAAVRAGTSQFLASFDADHPGFGIAPKFPRPAVLTFLLREAWARHDEASRDAVLATLRAMAEGGVHDQLGGGFHRYSVDAEWRVPHFEKMLYDQAQLAVAYLEGYQVTGDERYAGVARDILAYVRRDLTSPEGAFYSAEDADSPDPEHPGRRREGAFYVWTRAELEAALGREDASLFADAYGVTTEGNSIAPDPHGEMTGRNVLYAAAGPAELASRLGGESAGIPARLAAMRARLLGVRAKRPRPHLDDKVLTAWNGLMISAFAKGGFVLADPAALAAAERAASFVWAHLWREGDRTLLRRWRDGEAAIPGFVEDYAALIQGYLDLFEAGGDARWLERAIALQDRQDELFRDPRGAGYFSTDGRDASLLSRQKETYDGAEPSGNSLAALNLLRLARLTDRPAFAAEAHELIRWGAAGLGGGMAQSQPLLLSAILLADAPDRQIVLAGPRGSPGMDAMERVAARGFRPNLLVLHADGGDGQRRLAAILGYAGEMRPRDGKATAYVCANRTCDLPTTDPEEARRQLDR